MRALVLYVGETAFYPGHRQCLAFARWGAEQRFGYVTKVVNRFITGLIVKCLNVKIFCQESQ